jgi:RNA polymerase sigma-70 factor, ECF subfamily
MTATMWFSGVAESDRTALAAGLRRRDPELLDVLIARYEYRLFRYLMCLTANRAVAEDLFQETWMRVLDRGDQYKAAASFEAWLFTIARHLVVDFQRRKKWETLDTVAETALAAVAESPYDATFRHEREAGMQDAMARLAPIHREVLLLRFQEELPLTEIAVVVDAPLATVKSRLYRALAELREELDHA